MGIRTSIKNALTQPTTLIMEGSIREVIEEVLATKGFVMPGDHRALKEEVRDLREQLESADGQSDELVALKKKLNMAMGAIQAATAQLANMKSSVDQNTQRATSALASSEAASDGLTGLEDAFAALIERIGTQNHGNESVNLPSFDILDDNISSLKKALATGDHDSHLPALLAAEEAGRGRVGAINAIQQRM